MIAAGVALPAAALVFWRCAVAAVTVPALVLIVRRLPLLVVEQQDELRRGDRLPHPKTCSGGHFGVHPRGEFSVHENGDAIRRPGLSLDRRDS